MDDDFTVFAAQVAGAHGVGGNVRLRLAGDNAQVSADSLQAKQPVKLESPNGEQSRMTSIRSLRPSAMLNGAWIARFKGIDDRTAAQEVYGWSVFIPEAARPELPEGEYYVDQLIGLAVVTDAGRDLGTVTEVLHSPAHDVYETDKGALIPAVQAYGIRIDLQTRVITVNDVPGLLGER